MVFVISCCVAQTLNNVSLKILFVAGIEKEGKLTTIIPVMENSDGTYSVLGGNHMVSAIKTLSNSHTITDRVM